MGAVTEQAPTQSAVQELASELLPQAPELGRGMAEHLSATIPELAAIDDDELRAELLASTEANIAQVLRQLAREANPEEVVVPPEALDFLRGNVRRVIPLPVLLRS
jgi:alkanesulfonate monooxygenase SsuD/methylene tetrahydromethanopterin reductase-like flavin-dependent oxidoreductase (luciferase family)